MELNPLRPNVCAVQTEAGRDAGLHSRCPRRLWTHVNAASLSRLLVIHCMDASLHTAPLLWGATTWDGDAQETLRAFTIIIFFFLNINITFKFKNIAFGFCVSRNTGLKTLFALIKA